MAEQIIDLDTAKLAKEKGFMYSYFEYHNLEWWEPNLMWYGKYRYTDKYRLIGSMFTDTSQNIEQYYPDSFIQAPTQSLLQKWLREIHNIHVEVNVEYENATEEIWDDIYNVSIIRKGYYAEDTDDTYEKALEKGLLHSLRLLSIKND